MDVKKWWIFVCFVCTWANAEVRPWVYQCDQYHRCVKSAVASDEQIKNGLSEGQFSLGQCKLTCHVNTTVLWPLPRVFRGGKTVSAISIESIGFDNRAEVSGETSEFLQRNIDEQVEYLVKKRASSQRPTNPSGVRLSINFELSEPSTGAPRINRNVNERYQLKIKNLANENRVVATIQASNYFGARHGIETLFQLIEFDDVNQRYIVLDDVEIEDEPEFRHRGLTFDSSRNFMTVDVIKRVIDGLAASKLNVFHWHIVDTHSYPVEQVQEPINRLTEYGAYGPDQVYSQQQIKDIVQYANYRGVRVIPEFDQPAHVGNGWQFPGAEKYTVCLNQEPWYDYCVEPPCGQLNPTEEEVYNVLEKIYQEWYDMFQFDSFHMGADEVHFGCWNSSKLITDYMDQKGLSRERQGFVQLWKEFQEKSSERLQKTVKGKLNDDLEIIVWTSELTKKENIDNLPSKDYVIQLWNNSTNTEDPEIKTLADKGYRLIFSNFDQLYLDCGYGSWVGNSGNNWCSPYKSWQQIYEFDPYETLRQHNVEVNDQVRQQVLGGEVALWSEQADSQHVEGKIFPRAVAYAERLWSNPQGSWYNAEGRILEQRRRLVHRGINADRLQPEWCRQNEGQCYVAEYNPRQPAEAVDPQK